MDYYATYILVIIAFIITLLASARVKSTFKKYSKVSNQRGYTAAQVARMILDQNDMSNVPIERISGELTDHFDPTAKVVRLSDSVCNSTSVAAIGVAAHECGHAVQYKENYLPIKIRGSIIPITNFGSRLAVPLVVVGILFEAFTRMSSPIGEILINIGLIMYTFVVLFQLITLPVEFNASSRAMKTLETEGILYGEELTGARRTLSAAAMTYVAALAAAVAQLLRLIAIANSGRRN